MQTALAMANEVIKIDKELKELREVVKKIEHAIDLAGEWCEDQTLNQQIVLVGCMKDIRRFLKNQRKPNE